MTFVRKVLFTMASLVAVFPLTDRPRLTPEKLLKSSSDVVIGTVIRVYSNKEKTPHFETTLCVAEIAVENVEKGEALQTGDRAYAKYYYKTWIGDGQMPAGWNGQPGPADGARVKVYLRGSPTRGFDVVEPNGFANAPMDAKLDSATQRMLARRFNQLCIQLRSTPFMTQIDNVETKRVLVVQSLAHSIESQLGRPETIDREKLNELTAKLDDLDLLDNEQYAEKIGIFRKQIELSGR